METAAVSNPDLSSANLLPTLIIDPTAQPPSNWPSS